MGLSTEFLYRAHVEVDEFLQVGDTFRGRRTIVKVKTGWFEGPRLKGEILPAGGDWFVIRPGGVAEAEVRDAYRTDECAVCGVKGRVVTADDKIVFEYPADQLDHAHNLMPGKIKHADGIAEHEREFHEVTQTDEYKRRMKMYRDFIKGLKPAH